MIDVERIETLFKRITEFKQMALRQLKKEVDYGVIPGSDKPTLLKPGAEKLLTCLELTSTFDIVDSQECNFNLSSIASSNAVREI